MNDSHDQIKIKKLLKFRKTKLVKGKRNAETLILTLKPIFPNIDYNPKSYSNVIIGRVRLSLVTQHKTRQYINIGVDRLTQDQYLGQIPVENGEIDFVNLESEVKKAEDYLSQWDFARSLVNKFKSDLITEIKEPLKSVRATGIQIDVSTKCKVKNAKTSSDVQSTITIKGHLTKEQIKAILGVLNN